MKTQKLEKKLWNNEKLRFFTTIYRGDTSTLRFRSDSPIHSKSYDDKILRGSLSQLSFRQSWIAWHNYLSLFRIRTEQASTTATVFNGRLLGRVRGGKVVLKNWGAAISPTTPLHFTLPYLMKGCRSRTTIPQPFTSSSIPCASLLNSSCRNTNSECWTRN